MTRTTDRRTCRALLTAGSLLAAAVLVACGRGKDQPSNTAAAGEPHLEAAAVPTAPPGGKTPALHDVTSDDSDIWDVDSATADRYHARLHFDPSLSQSASIRISHEDTTNTVDVLLIPESRSHRLTRADLRSAGRLVYAVVLVDTTESIPDIGLDRSSRAAYLWVKGRPTVDDSVVPASYVVREPNGRFTEKLQLLVISRSTNKNGEKIPRPERSQVSWGRKHPWGDMTQTVHEILEAQGYRPPLIDHRSACFACDDGWCLVAEISRSTS